MFNIREEGQIIRNGFNFYPLSSNQVGFVFKLGNYYLFARYNKTLGKIKCHYHNTI